MTAILVVASLIIILVIINGLKGQIEALNKRIIQFSHELKNISDKPTVEPIVEHAPETIKQEQMQEQQQEEKQTQVQEQEQKQEQAQEQEHAQAQVWQQPPIIQKKTYEIPQTPRPTPMPPLAKQFNFERFIGENLINKIGIGILVIGIGLFVKYAIENEWITEIMRVAIGFISGGALLALAYRFHKDYRAFSSVLAGGAVAVFYFTVAIAFREYNIFGQTTSFIMMIAITAFSVWLSITFNRRELAILSLIGGMFTPFMVSRGDGNYHVLFTYIAILNVGMLALSLRKQWKELLFISFIGAQLIFWLYFLRDADLLIKDRNDIITSNVTRDLALLVYSSVYYIIFLLMPLVQVFRNKDNSKDNELHIIILIANSCLHLLAGVLLLQRMDAGTYKGLFTTLLAVVNGVVAALLYSNKKDKALFHLFAGLTISYVTLAAPMQFDANTIVLCWATEAVLLLWLFRKSNATIYYISSLILLALSFICFVTLHNLQNIRLDFPNNIRAMQGSIFVNSYFITRLYTALAFVAYTELLRRNNIENAENKQMSVPNWFPTLIGTLAAIMLFYTGNRELALYIKYDISFWKMAYLMIFTSVILLIIGRRAVFDRYRLVATIVLWGVVCFYYWISAKGLQNHIRIMFFNKNENFDMAHNLPVMLYWLGFAGLSAIFVIVARIFYRQYQLKSSSGKTMMWFFNIAAIICLSIATIELINQITSLNSHKATITVLWSLCAFVQMWLGMRLKYKTLRIISLSLLSLSIFKLFLFDLSNASQGAKIISFIVLGIVLLVLSFLYQKLKKFLFEDELTGEE